MSSCREDLQKSPGNLDKTSAFCRYLLTCAARAAIEGRPTSGRSEARRRPVASPVACRAMVRNPAPQPSEPVARAVTALRISLQETTRWWPTPAIVAWTSAEMLAAIRYESLTGTQASAGSCRI